MSSGANDQSTVLQFAAFGDHGWDMLRCIQGDHMFLEPNSFNRLTMLFFQQVRN